MLFRYNVEVQMVRGDFLNQVTTDWTDADIVFANSTCYDDDLMQRISDIACEGYGFSCSYICYKLH